LFYHGSCTTDKINSIKAFNAVEALVKYDIENGHSLFEVACIKGGLEGREFGLHGGSC
jgi:hypothetical protein